MFSTNGNKLFPQDLAPNLIGYEDNGKTVGKKPSDIYDMQLSFTALKNFPLYLKHGIKNRFGLWCFEFEGKNTLPDGFAKNYKFCDKLIAPSEHAKQVFVDSMIPANHIEIIPYGVDNDFIQGTDTYQLKTNKKFKVLCNIAQPHLRKNIPGILDAWGKAFTKKDDVVLVLKIAKINKINQPFEVNVNNIFAAFEKKYPDHAEILKISDFLPSMAPLYRACNALLSLSHAESFLMPALEALASKKILIVSNHGGQTDFCKTTNSLLVNGKLIKANPNMLYWQSKNNAFVFDPNTDHAAEQLQIAFRKENELLNSFDKSFNEIRYNYTWDKVTNKLLELVR
jgi:glycosyltransferase involved in cell wall biosynthesis